MKRESKCIILGICCIGVFLEELYFYQVYQNQIPAIAVGMGILLVLFHLLFSNLFALREEWKLEQQQVQEEQLKKQTALLEQLLSGTSVSNATTETPEHELSGVETLEKAIYVAVQKNTKTMQESLEQLDQHLAGDFENVVTQIQQTGERNAKISVKYGRENTKSLMVFQQKAYDNVVLGMEELANEFSASLQKTQEKLDIIINAMADGSVRIPTTDTFSTTTIPEATTSMEETPEAVTSEPVQEDISETYINTDSASTVEIPTPDTISEASAAIEEPSPVEETPSVSDDPNHVMTPEEIAALVAGNNEPSPVEEASPSVSDDSNHVMTPEEIAALVAGNNEPSPVEEASPSVSDDPNHVMTPEEIAALVAGNNESSPVEEASPSVSDDPNHVMTPEEIAALIAGNN